MCIALTVKYTLNISYFYFNLFINVVWNNEKAQKLFFKESYTKNTKSF